MSARMPTTAIGEPGSMSRTTPAATPNTPSTTLTPPKALPKAGVPSMATPRAMNETYGQEEEPYDEQRIEYALGRLPQEDERCLILGARPRSVVEVGDRGPRDLRKSSGREHDETH